MTVQMARAAWRSWSSFSGSMGCFSWRWIQECVEAPWKYVAANLENLYTEMSSSI